MLTDQSPTSKCQTEINDAYIAIKSNTIHTTKKKIKDDTLQVEKTLVYLESVFFFVPTQKY